MSLTLYGHPGSQPTRCLIGYLNLLGAKYDFKVIEIAKGEHLTEEYAKVNPFKLVPAIDDDGFKLAESTAIITYLAQTHKDSKYLPEDPKKAALVHQYFSWHHSNCRPFCAPHFGATYHYLFPHRQMPSTEVTLGRFEEFAKKFEDLFLNKNKFITGDEFTIADLLAYCEIQQNVVFCGYNLKEKFARVAEWYDSVSAVPGVEVVVKAAFGVKDGLDKLIASLKQKKEEEAKKEEEGK
jgi:glutathione S-transferase